MTHGHDTGSFGGSRRLGAYPKRVVGTQIIAECQILQLYDSVAAVERVVLISQCSMSCAPLDGASNFLAFLLRDGPVREGHAR